MNLHHINSDDADNPLHFMTSMILWIVGLTGFVLAGKHSPFLLDVPETSWGELIRMWGSWSLGSLSSIVMLIINYPKVRDVIKKHISNSKKRK